MLRDSVRAFLAARGDHSWAVLVDRLELGEALRDARQGAIVAEEIGRARAALPFAETAVTQWLLERCGGPGFEAAAVLTMAWAEPGMRYDMADIAMTARRDGDGWRLGGSKSAVGWAPACDRLVVAARTAGTVGERGGLSLFLLDPALAPNLRTHAYRTIDGRPAADLIFEDQFVGADALIGKPDQAIDLIEEARDRATALLAAEAVGLLDSLLAQCIAYTGQRRQFDRPLADFQALQHRMVDMLLLREQISAAALLAALKPGDARASAAAKATANEAIRQIGQEAVQLHGAMGMTEELRVGHYFKRATAIEQRLGTSDAHVARYAAEMKRAG